MSECELCSNEIDYHEIIDCITCALDARDPYTAGHSERVSDMALKVCQLIGLKHEDTLKIHIAAHLHDIGKIGVPDAILNKEGKLTDEEFAYIKKHPIIGAEILGKSHKLSELSDIVLMHHERFDGKGYPIGKAGADIPIGARIIAICDSIDAITSNRCYRKAHDFDYCYEEIEKNLGKMYDPIMGRDVLDNWDEIYGDYSEHLINESEYLKLKQQYLLKSEALKKEIDNLLVSQNLYSKNYKIDEDWENLINKYLKCRKLNKELADAFVDKVQVFEDGRISVNLVYDDCLEELLQVKNKREGDLYE